jgi:hypothetical protein
MNGVRIGKLKRNGRARRPAVLPSEMVGGLDQLRRVPSSCISIMNKLMKSR